MIWVFLFKKPHGFSVFMNTVGLVYNGITEWFLFLSFAYLVLQAYYNHLPEYHNTHPPSVKH